MSDSTPNAAVPTEIDPTHLSRKALERLVDEHRELTTHGREQIARRIEAARELGDLSENGDYHAAKEEQGKMEARVRQLEQVIENAQVIDDGDEEAGGDGVVRAGSIVSVRDAGSTADDGVERYLLGSIEERHDDLDVISPGSPLGQALMGRNEGDVVDYEAPGGTHSIEIVAVGS